MGSVPAVWNGQLQLQTKLQNRIYRKLPNIRRTKSQNLNDSRLVLHLSLPNLLKQGVK